MPAAPVLALVAALSLLVAGMLPACGASSSTRDTQPRAGDAALAQAFDDGAHDLEVEGEGTIVRILADDREGEPHQRFILRLSSGQTLLVAHNIDIAPRIEHIQVGDRVAFRGVYEWSEEGGTIHWTHRDPDGTHLAGWLRHGGRTYQ